MTKTELLARVSSQELTDWMAYYALEPFGQERGDLQAGVVASTVYNVNRGKGDKALAPADFALKFGPSVMKTRAKRKRKAPDWQPYLAFAQGMVAIGYGKITTAKEREDGSR